MRFALAIAASLLLAAPAFADARASGNTPVRAGPGERFRVIDRLADGAYYDVLRCTRQSRWCLVGEHGYTLGWVRGSYLVGSAAKNRVTPFEFLVNPELSD